MPLLKRFIEPKYVSRSAVPPNISNELGFISNSTLAHIMYQLSSLSKHSEDLFGELHRETSMIMYRASQLNERTYTLKEKIVRLNPVVEEVLLQDINMRKPFKSSVVKEQQITSMHSRPQAIAEVYSRVDPPPPLRILNPYRGDSKDSLKFYTDPGYFFELWSQEITKNAENQFRKNRHRKGRAVQRPTQEPPPPVRQLKCQHDDIKHDLQEAEYVSNSPRGKHVTPLYSSPGRQTIDVHKIQKEAFHTRQEDLAFRGDGFSPSPRSTSSQSSTSHFVYPSIRQERKPERSESERVHSLAQRMSREVNRCSFQAVPHGMVPHGMVPQGVVPQGGDPYHSRPYDVQQMSHISMHPGKNSFWEGSSPQHSAATTSSADENFYISQEIPTSVEFPSEHLQHPTQLEGSPKCRSRDSLELPLPPTPPMDMPSCYYPMPSPPLIPSPVPDYLQNIPLPGSPILPPPLYEANLSMLSSRDAFPQEYVEMLQKQLCPSKHHQIIAQSISGKEIIDPEVISIDAEDSHDPDRGHRSDLLAAIKKGIQLRKVEERRLKSAQRQQTKVKGHLDVQSIMEAAFEMRRKALDENESDEDDDELDNNWSDDN